MNLRVIASLALLGAALVAGTALAGATHDHSHAEIGKAAPDFALTDINGKDYKLSDYRGKYVVLEWTNPDCPFVRKHYDSGNMQSLQSEWSGKEVVWLTICSSAVGKQGYYEPEQLQKSLTQKKFSATAYLLDPSGDVGHLYDARTTPHMYVIDPSGMLLYAGAIDDKPSTNKADVDGATNYVQACLTAAMNGKEVATSATTPYGCSIKYASK